MFKCSYRFVAFLETFSFYILHVLLGEPVKDTNKVATSIVSLLY